MTDIEGRHRRHINQAVNIALKSQMLHRHGAVLLKGSKEVATGFNTANSRSYDSCKSPSCKSMHAEQSTLKSFYESVGRKKKIGVNGYRERVNSENIQQKHNQKKGWCEKGA